MIINRYLAFGWVGLSRKCRTIVHLKIKQVKVEVTIEPIYMDVFLRILSVLNDQAIDRTDHEGHTPYETKS